MEATTMEATTMAAWHVTLLFQNGRMVSGVGVAADSAGFAAQTALNAVKAGLIRPDDAVTGCLVAMILPELIAVAHRIVVGGQAPSAPVLTLHSGGQDKAPPIETQQAIFDRNTEAMQRGMAGESPLPPDDGAA